MNEPIGRSDSVADIDDAELLKRAMRNLAGQRGRNPLWTVVMDHFALGSTYSQQLCERFGLDPNMKVKA
jgi:hypothetical protein